MRSFFFLLVMGTTLCSAQAQAPIPTASRWNAGLKLGTGVSRYDSDNSVGPHPWTAFTGGLTGGYTFAPAHGFLTLQADALLERREARPWQTASATNAVLFVPVYLRTDPAVARVHFLLGGGPIIWLAGRTPPADQARHYDTPAVEATALLGVEVRLRSANCPETTLALTYRRGLTPALTRHRSSSGGHRYDEEEVHYWLGATLNVYFHPATHR